MTRGIYDDIAKEVATTRGIHEKRVSHDKVAMTKELAITTEVSIAGYLTSHLVHILLNRFELHHLHLPYRLLFRELVAALHQTDSAHIRVASASPLCSPGEFDCPSHPIQELIKSTQKDKTIKI